MEKHIFALNKLENEIKQYIHRYVKEKINNNNKLSADDKYYHVVELRDCIIKYLKYTYKITDVVVDDIIALICKKGYMRLSTLTSDINEHIKKNRKSEIIKTSFKTNEERMAYIKDYMKKNITSFGILTKPINHMFHWVSTKSGYTFYSTLDKDLTNGELKFFNNLTYYISDCFNHYN